MPGASRIGDRSIVLSDTHLGVCCPHVCSGPAMTGAATVLVNGLPALRVTDSGVHFSCCKANTWIAARGSFTVIIQGFPAVRIGDATQHCGGSGTMVEGSFNVIIGD